MTCSNIKAGKQKQFSQYYARSLKLIKICNVINGRTLHYLHAVQTCKRRVVCHDLVDITQNVPKT